MIPQAEDFKAESLGLHALLSDVVPERFDEKTQFKDWTINDVLQHLHHWNLMAWWSLTNEAQFTAVLNEMVDSGLGMRGFEEKKLEGTKGKELLDMWHEGFLKVSGDFADADPKQRLKWAGPEMSARSSITARLMETWAHGQEIYDHLGAPRVNTDSIKNIAYLGVNTFGYCHMVREIPVPENKPYVKLTAPSGDIWEWNEPNDKNFVEGDAGEFCLVVTQARNIAEVNLKVVGDVASQWMSIAQCFAGPAEDPPAVGTRFTKKAG